MVAMTKDATSAIRCSIMDAGLSSSRAAAEEAEAAHGHHHLAALIQHLAQGADGAAIGPALRRDELEDGHAAGEAVAGAHRFQPFDLVDAGRALALGDAADEAVDEEAHIEGDRVPAAGDEPAEDAHLRPLGIGVKGLWIELPGKGQDLGLAHRDLAEDQHLAHGEILEVPPCHLAPIRCSAPGLAESAAAAQARPAR